MLKLINLFTTCLVFVLTFKLTGIELGNVLLRSTIAFASWRVCLGISNVNDIVVHQGTVEHGLFKFSVAALVLDCLLINRQHLAIVLRRFIVRMLSALEVNICARILFVVNVVHTCLH